MKNNVFPKAKDIETEYLIIGSGVVGLLLATEMVKLDKEVWIIGSHYDSQFAKAGEISDSMVLPKGQIGLKHIEELYQTAIKSGVKHKSSNAVSTDLTGEIKQVSTKFQEIKARKVIIATGAKQLKIGFKGETEFFKKGISDCAVCDGALFKKADVAVFGAHEYTYRSAKYLANISSKVYLLWHKSSIPEKWKDECSQFNNLEIIDEISDIEALGSDIISKIILTKKGIKQDINIQGLFVEGKPKPSIEIFPKEIVDEKEGRIIIDGNFKTSIENVYALGDVTGLKSNYDRLKNDVSEFVNRNFKKNYYGENK